MRTGIVADHCAGRAASSIIRHRVSRILLLALLWAIRPSPAEAQADTASDFVFDDTSVPAVLITIDQALLEDILAPGNQYSDEERPASFIFARGTDSVKVDSVGFRLRGNTSRDAQKKSFKVAFNAFRRGQKFAGLEKLNLNGEHNDPSIVRSKLGWDLFRSIGVPASRANHVLLFINGDYYGLYVNVEHVDEQFLQTYFGNDNGNLYKCLWPADLAWLGPDPDMYRPAGVDRRPYDLRLKDSDLEGYDDLVQLIDVLNNSSEVQFPEAIQSVFNVNAFLRALAVITITGGWDSYWFLKNNYYLYSNPETGLFEYIPFDFDNIMGIWWDGIYPGLNWTTRDIYSWGHPDPGEIRPLTDRILAVPGFRSRYTLYVRKLLAGPFDAMVLESRMLALRSRIADAAVSDPFRSLDYGFSSQDFYNSYFEALGEHVTEGLVPFVTERVRSAASQLDVIDVVPVVSEVATVPAAGRPGAVVTFVARVEDEEPVVNVKLSYRIGTGPEQETVMTPEAGSVPDMYSATLAAPTEPSTIEYAVEASDPWGQIGASPTHTFAVLGELSLFINEFMASNITAVTDPFGEFDDWLELFNAGTTDLNVGGFTLTDDRSRPDKWELPDTTISAGGFVVVWADEDGSQGPLHANFRLSRLGEFLALYDAAGVPIDSLTFGEQSEDVSLGRSPDGSDLWSPQASATPGSSNTGAVGLDPGPTAVASVIDAYPNPFRSTVSLKIRGRQGGTFTVFDLLGRKVVSTSVGEGYPSRFLWDGRSAEGITVPSGVYAVRYSSLSGSVITKSIVRIR